MRVQPVTVARPGGSSAQRSLAETAYAMMHQLIVTGAFAPGQAVSRRKVAAELGISLLPASEAFLRLEWDGLLESRPRAGTRLRLPSRQDVHGHFVLCEALEVQAATMFRERSTAEERSALIKLAARVDAQRNQQNGEPVVYPDVHQELHLRIAECTRCDALLEAIGKTLALSSAWLGAVRGLESFKPQGGHRDLIRILSTATPTDAGETMRSHIRSNLEIALRALEPCFKLRERSRHTYCRTAGKLPRPGSGLSTVNAQPLQSPALSR
jgi:DNA-binding GntR family transcriptional regulator